MDYIKCAKEVILAVGGEDNFISVQHCVTRLRLVLKDRSQVDEATVKGMELVKGINDSNGQFQVIFLIFFDCGPCFVIVRIRQIFEEDFGH